jgi:hypothetical protein
MNLVSHIPGVGPTATFTPGPTTASPFNVSHEGMTDGTGPSSASRNMAEVYNRVLLQIAATVSASGLTVDNNNWAQLATAVVAIAENAATAAKESAWPVGSVYINATNTANPATIMGFGTWTEYGTGRFIVGQQSTTFPTLGATGGSTTATTTSSGGGSTDPTDVAMRTSGFTVGGNTPGITPLGRMLVGTGADEAGEFLESVGWAAPQDVSLGVHTHTLGTGHTHEVSLTPPFIVAKMWQRVA